MSAPSPRLAVSGLRKGYRATLAVADVGFEVAAGELCGVIGPNGAGKSTTARILTGQLLPDAGEVRVDGHRIDQEPLTARRLTGYVPQELSLYPFLTGRETLRFVGTVRGLDASELEHAVDALLERLGLVAAQHRLAREYSEGMARKLAIGCALLGDPPLLVLDESLNGLDPRAAAELKTVLRERVAAGTTVLLVSHELDVLERLCTSVVLIDRGKVVATLDRTGLDALGRAGSSLEAFFLEHTAA
ncbi:MAG: ABC transporter ATP-binding protein [Deltaproteobacteria bacterium]|nr:ABC transporter ATP-binding protein [Deltaproteobacteria bacterium]MCB9785824.1 ABC transporter ATP-binding protein [Deltaproteobacteria bacterium]